MSEKKYHSSKSIRVSKGIINDQFYTDPVVASRLVDAIKRQPWFATVQTVVEPSAGQGAFSDLFPNCQAYDIDPKRPEIIKADFLEMTFLLQGGVLCIGNPPFGRQSSLAMRFVKKCCEFADYIAFILPMSFQKVSVQNRVPLSHSLLADWEIDKRSFYTAEGQPYDVPCTFQIWHKQNRAKPAMRRTTPFFDWSTKTDGQLAVRRVGFNAGKAVDGLDYHTTCEKSHYYIKSASMSVEEIKDRLNKINWTNVASKVSGPRSISKSELIEIFEASLQLEPPSSPDFV